MRRITIASAVIIVLGATASNALAHDQWADGGPVPAWVKQQCCGVSDAHHLRPAQVHVTAAGYRIDGYREVIPQKTLLPSQDGDWWVFYRDYPNGTQSQVYCFFGPPQGS